MRMLAILLASATLAACGSAEPTRSTLPEPAPEAAAPPSIATDEFLDQYVATLGFRLGEPSSIEVTPDGSTILFLRTPPRSPVRDLYAVDVATGQERVLLTAEQLLGGGSEQLSAEERARRERMRERTRGITSYELSRDGRRILVPLSGKLYVYDRESTAVRELASNAGYPNDPHFSPDGTQVACVRDGDLYLTDVASGSERRITSSASEHVQNGLAEFVAQEEMGRFRGYWFSPDGSELLYQQTDTSRVEQLHASDPMHPEQAPSTAAYPRAGRNNAVVRLGIVSARIPDPSARSAGPNVGATRWLDWNSETHPYFVSATWSENAPPTIVVEDRRQQEALVLLVDPRNGSTTVAHRETDSAWLNLPANLPEWLPDGSGFLWMTERNGAPQLELRGREGTLVRALTEPELGLESFIALDGERKVAWVTSAADPLMQSVFRVPLDASAGPVENMTPGAGEHWASVGRSDVWVMSSFTSQPRAMPCCSVPPPNVAYRAMRGREQLFRLSSVAEAPPFEPNLELATVGERDYRASIIRPRNFEAGRSYPVLLWVYGGPGHRQVGYSSRRYLLPQWFADHGFIVVSADGRGTPGRGREWERAIQGNFIDVPLADQVDALQALGARFPEMDLDRVGVYGWSFGGYFSAMAVMQRPDVFRAGIAGAPVADWSDYDTHYTERYLGLPSENPTGYASSSVLTHAPELTRPLLIAHGTSDDNVYFTHAIKMSDALLRAGRDHELLPLSGFTHMVAEPAMMRSLYGRFASFFERNLAAH